MHRRRALIKEVSEDFLVAIQEVRKNLSGSHMIVHSQNNLGFGGSASNAAAGAQSFNQGGGYGGGDICKQIVAVGPLYFKII